MSAQQQAARKAAVAFVVDTDAHLDASVLAAGQQQANVNRKKSIKHQTTTLCEEQRKVIEIALKIREESELEIHII